MNKSRRFHQLLRDAREQARQSTEVMGILLNMDEQDYIAIERGEAYPDNETLKRLCVMLEWNYYDTQRAIINEIAARPGGPSAGGEAALRALQSVPLDVRDGRPGQPDSLGARLRQVRTSTGQAEDIIAMLLGIPVEHYRRVEAGEAPNDALLRRISMVYGWNYQDLRSLLRSEQARTLQPWRVGSPYPGASAGSARLKSILQDLEALFVPLAEPEQQMVLTQLELIRETMRKVRNPAAPGQVRAS